MSDSIAPIRDLINERLGQRAWGPVMVREQDLLLKRIFEYTVVAIGSTLNTSSDTSLSLSLSLSSLSLSIYIYIDIYR